MTVRNARCNDKDKRKALRILIFIFLYARRENLLPVVMKPFVNPNSLFEALTIRRTPKHLPLSICVWPLSMFQCSVTLGSESCFAISGVDRPVCYVAGR